MRRMDRRRRVLPWITGCLGVAALGLGTFGLTASNAVPATKAGDGSGAVSGYTVSAVSYTLNASNPSNLDQVSFTVDTAPAAGSTMKVQLAAGGSWYSCTNSGTTVSCATTSPQATVAGATTLRVVIAQ